jgi:hypothetical protein
VDYNLADFRLTCVLRTDRYDDLDTKHGRRARRGLDDRGGRPTAAALSRGRRDCQGVPPPGPTDRAAVIRYRRRRRCGRCHAGSPMPRAGLS